MVGKLTGMQLLSEYRVLFLAAFLIVLVLLFVIVAIQMVARIREFLEERENELTKEEAQNLDYEQLVEEEKGGVIRRIIAPDFINPGPDDHLIIGDGVKKAYSRTMTISIMARKVNFANTFAPLLDFPDCTSTVFVEPIDEQTMGKQLDKHLIVLESEFISADGDSNRQRKLQAMYAETNEWAGQVETGKNKFFRVGFIFTIYADNLEQLTKQSDAFRNIAKGRGLDVTVNFGVQSEAYLSNMPMNRYFGGKSPVNATDGTFYHYMDKYSVATIFNYTSATFSHRDGIPLGRDRHTHKPVIYNPYNVTYNGFTHVVVGKTGSGKSATLKMLAYRCSIFNYRFASLDVQPRRGTGDGEYAGICDLLGGLNFELKSESSNCLNIFEVMETKTFQKTGIGEGIERRTLDLRSAIAQSLNLIKIMIAENGTNDSLDQAVYMDSIIREAIEQIYAQKGIVDGDADSLYIITGDYKKEKELPTLTDFYKVLLLNQLIEDDEDKKKTRKLVILAMEKYVKDLFYSEDTCRFFTEDEYYELGVNENGQKVFRNNKGRLEVVRRVHGTRSYFDGQSTLRYSAKIPWVNIDCSQMDEASKQVAMSVGMNYINERIIKGNSENRERSANKVACIFDEAHMVFKIPPARVLLSEIVATARKRSVAMFICTQTLKEFEQYEETRKIRTQAAASFVFKQDYSDRQFLIETLGLTEAQVDEILAQGGDIDRMASVEDEGELEKEAAKHRGEMTIIINRTAIPIKVDYRKSTECYAVETEASEIIRSVKSAS